MWPIEEPDGWPADCTRSPSAVISAISTNSWSRILLAILDGTIATGLKGPGTNNCIWCGTGLTVSALGVAPDGLEERPLKLGGLGQNGLLGQLRTLALTVGSGLR